MNTETWTIIIGISGLNIFTIIGGIIHLTTRLTRIETDLKWIKRMCPQCQEIKKEE